MHLKLWPSHQLLWQRHASAVNPPAGGTTVFVNAVDQPAKCQSLLRIKCQQSIIHLFNY